MSYAFLRRLLVKHKGFRLHVYDDATGEPIKKGYTLKGHPTIGVGRNLATTGITEMEAHSMLAGDVENVIRECARFPWFANIGMARQDVVASMIFQLGPTGFRAFRKLIEALECKDYVSAAEEMMDSLWAKQVPERSAELSQMMRTGQYIA
jgi:lysozyme